MEKEKKKDKIIKGKRLIFLTIFIMTFISSCNGQDKTNNQKDESIKLKVKISNMLPVGWGIKYKATIEKIVEGSTQDFNDTILFGITAEKDYKYFNIGDTCMITIFNSKKISTTTYLPPITGTVSKLNEIWLISKIDRASEKSKRRTFVGTAIMSDGKPMFVWEFTDSESFYIDGLKSWDDKYLNKTITIEGILTHYIDGLYSGQVIKDWKIIDSDN